MKNQLIFIGMFLLVIGIFLLIVGSILNAKTDKVRFSFFGLVGPIPFGFANDKRMLYFSIILTLVLLIFFYFFLRKI